MQEEWKSVGDVENEAGNSFTALNQNERGAADTITNLALQTGEDLRQALLSTADGWQKLSGKVPPAPMQGSEQSFDKLALFCTEVVDRDPTGTSERHIGTPWGS